MINHRSQDPINNIRRLLHVVLAVVFMGTFLWGVRWAAFARPPLAEAVVALESDELVNVIQDPWLTFIPLSTLAFEQRSINSIKIDTNDNVVDDKQTGKEHPSDVFSSRVLMKRICKKINLSMHQLMTAGLLSTYRNHNGKVSWYDITLLTLTSRIALCL